MRQKWMGARPDEREVKINQQPVSPARHEPWNFCSRGMATVLLLRRILVSVKAETLAGIVAVVIALFVWVGSAHAAEPLALRSTDEMPALAGHVDVLEDLGGQLSVAALHDSSTQPWRAMLSKGYGHSSSAFWFRFTLKNDSPDTRRFYLELSHAILDDVRLYAPEVQAAPLAITGDHLPFDSRLLPHRNFVFPLDLPPDQARTYYLRIASTGAIIVPLSLASEGAWRQRESSESYILMMFYGGLIAIALYNLFLLFFTRDRNYGYYVLYVLGGGLSTASLNGLAFQYLWPQSPWWANASLPCIVTVTCMFGALFGRSFLNTRENIPQLDYALRAVIYLAMVVAVAGLFVPYRYLIHGITSLVPITVAVLLFACVVTLVRGYRPARFFLFGAVFFLIGSFIRALLTYDLVPVVPLTTWSVEIGLALDSILFSVALADRINILRADKEAAQTEAIANLQRLDAFKDGFLAATSHELRTPLNGIIGLSEMLLAAKDPPLGPSQSRSVGHIVVSGRRLLYLIDDLLDMSLLHQQKELRMDSAPVNVGEVVEVVVALCQPLLGAKAVCLRVALPHDLPPVAADEQRLQQILYNLIGNAIKYTDAGEIVVLAWLEPERRQLVLAITDTGIGMDAEQQRTAFDIFHQLHPERHAGGVGLGLSITRELVRLQGGEIELKSTPGAGTEVRFSLPLAEPGVQPQRPTQRLIVISQDLAATPQSALVAAKGRCVLAVDDDPLNLEVLTTLLIQEGYAVATAFNGSQALAQVESVRPDLVLLDAIMPGLDGYEVCRRLRQGHDAATLPIIMVTALFQAKDKERAFAAGANDYLSKPFERSELLGRIHAHLSVKAAHQRLQENERLRHEVEFRQAAEKNLSRLLDMQKDAILAVDRDWQVIYLNRKAQHLWGYGRDEALTLPDLLTDAAFEGIKQALSGMAADQQGIERLEIVDRDGQVFGLPATLSRLSRQDGMFPAALILPSTANGSAPTRLGALQNVLADLVESEQSVPLASSSGADDAEGRQAMVEAMQAAVFAWEKLTLKSRVELAETSGLWSVTQDRSTMRSKALERYLDLAQLPKHPRWKTVLQTLDFVATHCPPAPAKERMQAAAIKLRSLLGDHAEC